MDIAQTGDSSKYDWQLLKHYIILCIKDALLFMETSFPDFGNEKPGETYRDVLGELVELFYLFENE